MSSAMTDAQQSTRHLADLLRQDRAAMADFLVALAEFDRRELWRDLGYTSLFYFLYRELGMSAGASHYRKTAAQLLQRFPEVIEPLRDGRLCVTSVVALAKVMTPENRREVLPRFFHLSKREAAAEVVVWKPVETPPQRDVVTRIAARSTQSPAPAASPDATCTPSERDALSDVSGPGVTDVSGSVPTEALHPVEGAAPDPEPERRIAHSADFVEPLDASESRLHITVSRRFLDKLAQARDALSHARPGGSAAEILEAGLDLVLAQDRKRKGLVEKPRAARPSKPDHIPAHVKREALKRADGRCEFPLPDGRACGSTWRLQFDHIVPRARGGPSTIENIRVLCGPHNLLAAEQVFGREHMDRFRRTQSGAHACDDAITATAPLAKEAGFEWGLTPWRAGTSPSTPPQ